MAQKRRGRGRKRQKTGSNGKIKKNEMVEIRLSASVRRREGRREVAGAHEGDFPGLLQSIKPGACGEREVKGMGRELEQEGKSKSKSKRRGQVSPFKVSQAYPAVSR